MLARLRGAGAAEVGKSLAAVAAYEEAVERADMVGPAAPGSSHTKGHKAAEESQERGAPSVELAVWTRPR